VLDWRLLLLRDALRREDVLRDELRDEDEGRDFAPDRVRADAEREELLRAVDLRAPPRRFELSPRERLRDRELEVDFRAAMGSLLPVSDARAVVAGCAVNRKVACGSD
jgi:hypothetical protein